MKIKNFLRAFVAFATIASLAACTPAQEELSGEISLSTTSLEFPVEGGAQTVTLEAGLNWTLQGYTDEVKQWLAINPQSGNGSASPVEVSLTAIANTGANRTATITFYGNVLKKVSLVVSQSGEKGEYEVITIAKFLELKDAQNDNTICGEVTEKATASTYWGIVLKDETGTLSCPFPQNWDDFKDQIAVGKKVTIKGVYNYYESKQQDQMKNGTILAVEAGEPAKPAEGEIYVESFATGFGEWTIEDKTKPSDLTAVWVEKSDYACVMASGYANSTNYATESWLVSPVIDLSAAKTAYLEYDQAVNYFTSLDVAKTQAVPMARVENGEWSALTVVTWQDALSWNFRNTGSIDLAAYVGKKIQIAFKYVSTTEKAGSWELKNVKITEEAQEGPKEDKEFTADVTWVINDVKGIFAAATDETYKAGFAGTQDGITLGFYKNTSSTSAVTPTDILKFYKSHVMIISSEKKLKAVRFTCTGSDYFKDLTAIEPTSLEFTKDAAGLTIKAAGEADKYIVSASAQVRFTKIEFDFAE